VLFDGADQSYRKEDNVPKLGMFDRGRFIKRKLEQAFPNYPIRAAQFLTDRSYLFAAVPETENVERVGAALLEAGVPVEGFGLLPVESAGLVNGLSDRLFGQRGARSRWAVLIGQNETGGLRQIVIRDGALALTRLTPPSDGATAGAAWVEDVMREFKATLTYIARFGYTADEGLDVIVIAGDAEKKAFEQEKYLPGSNFRCLKVPEALMALGLGGFGFSSAGFADALYAVWAGSKRQLTLPVRVPSIERIVTPRKTARIFTFLLLAALIGAGGFVFSAWQDLNALTLSVEQKQNQKNLLLQEFQHEQETLAALPVKPERVRGALAVQSYLDSSSVSITPTLNALRSVLAADMRLTSLTFEHTASPPPRPVVVIEGTAPPPAVHDPGKARIRLRFTLSGSLTLEQKVNRTEAIAAQMKQVFAGYEVKILSQFGGVTRTGRFEGSAGGDPTAPDNRGNNFAEIELQGKPL